MPTVELSEETQALLDSRLRDGDVDTADELLKFALTHLGETPGEAYEDLDAETPAAIEEATAEQEQGLGRPWANVRDELRAEFDSGAAKR